ncbi:hypothetical protein COT75_04390 [Candidatus Beckwithbacteria bacterium CG10_big_fil_rev_8_21_14_0_10_34_10]|uniref:Uncharacterized protein n=1 Tax=Candidatus Beckwithbacteria bacterium CG10_big_fil_rev_8_21_14_0_10_34_10 TaxID=1974495 RepID=A0A2H0W8D9_9BACT|nr:MAG: hypothetical protein COT75_04390 [Candidatus Beckwithbacteria bacterium CG10_big_fil_rev_8_21_14_0_10_34_10]
MESETGLFSGKKDPIIFKKPDNISPPVLQSEDEQLVKINQGFQEVTLPLYNEKNNEEPVSLEKSSTEKLSFKELVELGKKENKTKAEKHIKSILLQEYQAKRLTREQYQKFLVEIKDFSFNKIIQDILGPGAITLGYTVGVYSTLGKTLIQKLSLLKTGLTAGEFFSKALVSTGLAPLFGPFDFAGIFRAPYHIYRSVQELKKLGKEAYKSIPFYLGLNVINFFKTIGPLSSIFLSFPRNKDVGLAIANNQVQAGKWPSFLKKGVDFLVQKLFEKPKSTSLQLQPQPA